MSNLKQGNMMEKKSVFVVMSAEFFHPGHLNIINVARELGEVTVGLATDELNARYKRLSWMSYEERKAIVENIKGVERVIPQDTLNLAPTLRKLRPNFFVHGDDWKIGPLRAVRQQVLEVLEEWGGILIEPPYTKGISSTQLNDTWRSLGVAAKSRTQHFRRLLAFQPIVRMLEVHNNLTGLIVEKTQVRVNGKVKEFDGMWYSSLTDSLSTGKPINGYFDLTSRTITIQDILNRTTKPLVVDVGSGGRKDHFIFIVTTLERIGASAVAINDGAELVENAFSRYEFQDRKKNVDAFALKIYSGKKTQLTEDFSIIAGINTHLSNGDSKNVLKRAQAYIEAGADAIMVLSYTDNLEELFEFSHLYSKAEKNIPLIAVIPGLNSFSEDEIISTGFQVIVYSDHLLRAAYTNCVKTARFLLSQPEDAEKNELSVHISELIDFVYGNSIDWAE